MALFCKKKKCTRAHKSQSAGEEFINWILNLAVELLLSPMPPPPLHWMACPDEQKWKTHLKKIKNNSCVFPLVFYLLSLLAQTRFTPCHIHNFFFLSTAISLREEENNVSICQELSFFLVPGGVREIVGISLGKGCSGLKSHLVELVIRADMRVCLGRWRILHRQVGIMSCAEDGPMYQIALYHFIGPVICKIPQSVCERDTRNQQWEIVLTHLFVCCVHVWVCEFNRASTSRLPRLPSCFLCPAPF